MPLFLTNCQQGRTPRLPRFPSRLHDLRARDNDPCRHRFERVSFIKFARYSSWDDPSLRTPKQYSKLMPRKIRSVENGD